jgi:hypothetical protein
VLTNQLPSEIGIDTPKDFINVAPIRALAPGSEVSLVADYKATHPVGVGAGHAIFWRGLDLQPSSTPVRLGMNLNRAR